MAYGAPFGPRISAMPPDGVEQNSLRDSRTQITALKSSIAADWYEPNTFIPWSDLDSQLGQMTPGLHILQGLVSQGALEAESLGDAILESESVLDVIRTLFVAPRGAGFVDGRLLPLGSVRTVTEARRTAGLAIDLGINKLLSPQVDVRSIVQASLIAIDARRRGFRRGHELESAVAGVISQAIRQVQTELGMSVKRATRAQVVELRSRLDEVLTIDGRAFAAIQSVFQVSSGGRQQRDLSTTYPLLQQSLQEQGISLILIVDGDGIRQAPDRVLEALVGSVFSCMTLSQARLGALAEAVVRAARSGAAPTSLRTVIDAQLLRDGEARADLLPSSSDAALNALARFVEQHPERALSLDPVERVLTWPAVREFRRSVATPPNELLARALSLDDIEIIEHDEMRLAIAQLGPDRILPERLYVGWQQASIAAADVRRFSIEARNGGAKIAVLIGDGVDKWRLSSESQLLRQELATSVVVIDALELPAVIGAKDPKRALIRYVLEQADLTKANPYSQHGVTRSEMFFGRDTELAEMRATLETNSIALLGGRRIGKTSLLRRTVAALHGERWAPTMADCQAVGDWHAFRKMMQQRHGLELAEQPSAAAVTQMVDLLALRAAPARPVLVLDEVDNLLRWDMSTEVDGVREVIFRSFRAASQEDRIRFVFSGERLIYDRLGDPTSPHWNFCRPLALRQLSFESAMDLFERPLFELGVEIDHIDEARAVLWERTQGHPQIVQYIGGNVVQLLNQRPPQDRANVSVEDLLAVVDTVEFAAHYVATYWGQASDLEKTITGLMALGAEDTESLAQGLGGLLQTRDDLSPALRMLELYGIIEGLEPPYRFRAIWFPEALAIVEDVESLVSRKKAEL